MTTEADQKDSEVLDTDLDVDATETQEAEAESGDTEIDWKAQAAELKQHLVKLENDKRSLEVNRLKQNERDELILEIRDRLDANEKSTDALLRSLGTGDTERLPDEIQQIRSEAEQSRVRSSYETQFNSLVGELADAVKDDDGNVVLDIYTAPELEATRQEWSRASGAGDLIGLTRALNMAYRAVASKERVLAKQAKEDVKKAAKEARRKALEDVGAHDLDVGPGSSSTSDGNVYGLSRMKRGLNSQ